MAPHPFLVSRFPVLQNAIKNLLFRGATIILTVVFYRLFAFLAFRKGDYTSFLMFAEDLTQKFLFALSRKFNRQTVLVTSFAGFTFAAGFYDTLLWAVDSPGYVIKSKPVNAEILTEHMVAAPSYITLVSNPERDLNKVNVQDIFGANLYSPGFNFTLPGIVDPGTPEPITPLKPLFPGVISPRIWLDSTGFAVGLDDTIMMVPNLMNTTQTSMPCIPSNAHPAGPDTLTTVQTWICVVRNEDAHTLFTQLLGRPKYWWDSDPGVTSFNVTSDFNYLLASKKDNPWVSLGTGGGTAMMKQLFTVTKGSRRHTFLQTTFKATMISNAPMVFADAEITDFIKRLWGSPNQPMTPAVQRLVNATLQAHHNRTSLTFGLFKQRDEETVVSQSTEYLCIIDPMSGEPHYTAMRFGLTLITLIDSETLLSEPFPLRTCNGFATNIGMGGIVQSMNCDPPSTTSAQPRFFGQLDTTSVVIINDILGDGTNDTSAVALNQAGLDWYSAHEKNINKLLTSRGLIMGRYGPKVIVDVQTNEAAISYLQLILLLLPIFLALIVWGTTFQKPMSYYKNSFVAAVFATAHVTGRVSDRSECKKVGYMQSPPEVELKTRGGHVTMQTPNGELVAVPGGRRVFDYEMASEPLILPDWA